MAGRRTVEQVGRPLRVAVVYRVCQHWRAPMFARLNRMPDLDICVFHGKSISGTKLINGEKLEGFAHHESCTVSGRVTAGGRTTPWVFCPFLAVALAQYAPDVIVVEGGSNVLTNVPVFLYAKLFRKPVVWWTLGELPGREYRGVRKLYRAIVKRMERASSALLGYSSVALAYFARMGYEQERFFRAVNCVDTDRVEAAIAEARPRVAGLRDELDLGAGRVVLFVGALTRGKHIHRLLHAFQRVRAKLPDARLLIVGDGPDRAELEALADELGLRSATRFVGQVIDGIAAYYQLADIFVLPGLGGLAVSEAMAHGLPVICCQGDGCEVDLVRDHVSGFRLGNIDDAAAIEAIADKVTATLASDVELSRMSAAARQVIVSEHNVNTYLENVADAIRFAYDGRRRLPMPVWK